MAKQFPSLDKNLIDFIERQHIFFVASATADSRVNVSPKGGGSLRVLDANKVAYLDQTGSGNETSAHMLADGRMTIMFCAFEGLPMILRLYGRGRVVLRGSEEYQQLLVSAFEGNEPVGARQIVIEDVDLVQTSCGYSVPLYAYQEDRPNLLRWAEAQGEEGLDTYRRTKNVFSMDGLPTGLFDAD
ncbi:MAG: pyridoxamine 5'-phosphate oxidase family protein [Rhizobiales bacterium]|nr:pyridoxamine 5'-phosphate oxidase family protein [Hyphomicrobiales bacterium]